MNNPVQIQPHVGVRPGAFEHLDDPINQLAHERCIRAAVRVEYREIDLLEYDEAAGTQTGYKLFQHGHGIGQVHEHQPSDQGVEAAARFQGVHVAGKELHVTVSRLPDPVPGGLQDLRIHVYTYDLPFRTDELRRDQCHVARSAADVEDPHSPREAGRLQKPLRDRSD